ncbi:MAG TPA: hypothetical protein VG275_05305 [Solirubrobacteraceae bacterium]|jgi:hypothetical protein|nr:hypothetical protein [Solirubrobacteraceae bacterium]
MSYRIDPASYCAEEGCSRPKVTGEELCALCLARTSDPEAGSTSADTGGREAAAEALDFLASEAKLPRCVAYLSKAGDVITLELTGEPKFTEADVELVAAALSNQRTAA